MSILVATGFVRIDSDTKPALKALKAFGAIGGEALTTSLLPATAAVSAGLLSVSAAAGVAAGAMAVYAAAVVPQFKDIAKANQKQAAAEDAKTKAAVQASVAQDMAAKFGYKYGDAVKITADMSAEAKDRATEYNKALASSKTASGSAAKAQALYKQELDAMPPATRKTSEALLKLKDDSNAWSRSLSSSTMPVFTKGIQFLTGLLPKLTPIVKGVSVEVNRFVGTLGDGVAGRVFREFGKNVQESGAGALGTFLDVTRNLIVGITGVLNAFMPMSKGVTGGLADMTEKFALWGANLGKSSGFQEFLDIAKDAGPKLAELLRSLGRAFMDVASAAGPMSGIGLELLTIFAKLVDAIPERVLRALVPTLLAVNTAMKLYAIYSAAAAGVTWLFTTSITANNGVLYTNRAVMISHRIILIAQAIATAAVTAATWLWSAAVTASSVALRIARGVLLAFRYALVAVRLAVALTTLGFRLLTIAIISNPIGLIIAAVVALGVAFFVLWKKSETFRNIVKGALNGIKDAALAVARWFSGPFVNFFKSAWDLYWKIFVKPFLWFYTEALPGAAKYLAGKVVEYWNKLVAGVKTAWDFVYKWVIKPYIDFYLVVLPNAVKYLRDKAVGWWNSLASGVRSVWNAIYRATIAPFVKAFTVTLPDGARSLRNRVVSWWNSLYSGIQTVYRFLKGRIFDPLKNFFTREIPNWASTMSRRVRGFFSAMRDGIGTIWKGIQEKTKSPVNWVIKHVWNDGIQNVWGKIAGWVGISNKLKDIKLLAAGGTVGNRPVGMFNRPTAIVGEGNSRYPEYVIPTDPKYRGRARSLHRSAGMQLMADGGIIGTIGSAISSAAGKVTSLAKGAVDFFTDPTAMAKKLFQGPLGKLGSLGGSQWATMVAKLPHTAVDGLLKAVETIGSSALGAIGLGSGNGGSGVSRWRGIVQVLLRTLGQPAAYTDLTLRRMNQESGGNPRAVNLWDSNAKAGHPSVGLMQVIRGTFNAYAGKYRNTGPFMYGVSVDPAANIYSSMKYALSRYGSLPRAYNRAGGYANGTAGTASGWHMFGENGPEAGFSPAGWRILNARQTAGMGGAAGMHVERLVIENHGVIGSRHEVENWLVDSLDQLRRKGRL